MAAVVRDACALPVMKLQPCVDASDALMTALNGRRRVGTRPPGFTLLATEYTPKTDMLAYSLLIGVSARACQPGRLRGWAVWMHGSES